MFAAGVSAGTSPDREIVAQAPAVHLAGKWPLLSRKNHLVLMLATSGEGRLLW
jgi:hypothetical protein